MESSATNDLSESKNNTMAKTTTNQQHNNTSTESPLKHLHNEWRCLGHLNLPDEAANEVLDFIKAVVAHSVCYRLTMKKQTQCNCLAELSSQMDNGPSFTCCCGNSLGLHAKRHKNKMLQ